MQYFPQNKMIFVSTQTSRPLSCLKSEIAIKYCRRRVIIVCVHFERVDVKNDTCVFNILLCRRGEVEEQRELFFSSNFTGHRSYIACFPVLSSSGYAFLFASSGNTFSPSCPADHGLDRKS